MFDPEGKILENDVLQVNDVLVINEKIHDYGWKTVKNYKNHDF